MRIYISGAITGIENYKAIFDTVAEKIKAAGHTPINPAIIAEIQGLEYEEYMHIDFALIDFADAIYMIPGWSKSNGAVRELSYAMKSGKKIYGMRD